jgi:serine/threonine protein kinase
LIPATEDAVPEPTTEVHRPADPPPGGDLSWADLPLEDAELIDQTCREYENALLQELRTSGRLVFSLDPFMAKVAERLRPALRRELQRVELRVEEEWWPCLPDYETLLFLAKGGMGRVYQMRRRADGEEVAVKLLLGAELTRVPRLRRIVEHLAHIDHQNLVRLYDITVDNSRTYLVMEFIRGNDLGQERGNLRLSVPNLGERDWANRKQRFLDLFQDITDAVVHLHQRGVIHRDLKPENVILDGEGHAHVCDVGLARLLEETDPFTIAGLAVGTRPYMAPEQAGGCSDVTLAVDVWALGAILYEFLTGLPPFVSEGPKGRVVAEDRKQTEPVPPPSSCNLRLARDFDLDYLCGRCLAFNPAERYSAAELADNLRRYRQGVGGIAPRQTWWQWLKGVPGALKQPLRDEDYHRRHFWNFLVEAGTSLAGHVGFFLLLSAAMPGQVLWAWLLLAEISGGWVNWLWNKGRRPFSPMERDVLQLWTGLAIADAILLYLYCPLWGPVEAAEAVRFYPAWAVVQGVVFFVEGRLCWSRLYFIGAAFFAAAVLLPLAGLLAPVAYGLLHSATFVWLSLQGKPERPTGSSETTIKSP